MCPPWSPSSVYYPSEEEIRAREKREAEGGKPAWEELAEELFTIAAKPESGIFGQIYAVKMLRDANKKFHFLNTNKFPFHYQYCVQYLGEKRSIAAFNEQVYPAVDRSAIYGTIVRYPGLKGPVTTFELNPAGTPINMHLKQPRDSVLDPLVDVDHIAAFFRELQSHVWCGQELKFRATSPAQAAVVSRPDFPLPKISSAELFGNVQYQPVVLGTARGVTRCFKTPLSAADLASLTPHDIVVLAAIPNDLPPVAGVVSAQMLPPLCHIALLCQNRKTPCFFTTRIRECEVHEGQETELRVASSDFTMSEVPGRVKTLLAVAIPTPAATPTSCVSLDDSAPQQTGVAVVGAKAAQWVRARAALPPSSHLHGSFAIPMGAYLAAAKPRRAFEDIHSTHVGRYGPLLVPPKQTQDLQLLSDVRSHLEKAGIKSAIFRSSTNAEDLDGFNGAGLYESVAVKDTSDAVKIDLAIRQVWASLWTWRAFQERQHYGIPAMAPAMAILVQPFLAETVQANAVALTCNPLHPTHFGIFVNAHRGSAQRSTDFNKDSMPEQTVIHLSRTTTSVDVELVVSASDAQPVLQRPDFLAIATALQALHCTWYNAPISAKDTRALDVELLLVGDRRELVVLQARPYQITRETQP